MKTLYRKYRSQDFDEILGQENIVRVIQKQIKDNRVGHAYLLTGPRGTGKTSVARLIAKAVNCKNSKDGNPCKSCDSCKSIEKGKALDLIEIDAASNRGIDEIRRLRERVNFNPTDSKYKVYIIDEVHMMTKDAFNALLKTLEEPPDHVIFILATTEPHKILPTILSRCQRFNFKLADEDTVIKKLVSICEQEEVDFAPEALRAIAKFSGGSFRDSESILEKVLGAVGVKSDGKVDVEDVTNILGIAEHKEVKDFVAAILQREANSSLEILDQIVTSGINLNQFIRQALEQLREYMIDVVVDKKRDYSLSSIVSAINELSEAENKIKYSSVPRLPLEVSIVKLCANKNAVDESKSADKEVKNVSTSTKKTKMTQDKKKKDNKGSQISKSEKNDSECKISLKKIKANWVDVIEQIRPFNHHLYAFFMKANPIKIEKNKLFLQVPFKFHKQRIESNKSQKIFEKVCESILNVKISCLCEVKKKEEGETLEENTEEKGNSKVVLEVLGDLME